MQARIKNKGKNKYVIINCFGKEIPVENIDALFQFKGKYAIYRIKDPNHNNMRRYGYYTETGEKLTEKIYDHADNFIGKYGVIKNGGMQNLINENGNEVLSWNYAFVEPFIKNTFIINYYSEDGQDLWGLVDLDENFIIPPDNQSKFEVMWKARNIMM